MIILFIIAALLLIPFTLFLGLLFNVYLKHWAYWLIGVLFFFIYASMLGFVLFGLINTYWIFMILIVSYGARMCGLAKKLHIKNKNYSVVRGVIDLNKEKLHVVFIFPLSVLEVLRWTPKTISIELSKKLGRSIDVPALVAEIISCSLGTTLEIVTNEAKIYFVIE